MRIIYNYICQLKLSVISVLSTEKERNALIHITAKASIAALMILLGSMIFGNFILQTVFRVNLYSLRVAGGAVLCWVGFNALRKGVFFEKETQARFEDTALVPLACPLIAGPATIAACIALQTKEGLAISVTAIIFAVMANHIVMVFSRPISSVLGRFNSLGAIVRLTGLIVMTIGTQMAFEGITEWQTDRLPQEESIEQRHSGYCR